MNSIIKILSIITVPVACANAQEPAANIAVIINGIGFEYVPSISSVTCIRGMCQLIENAGGVSRQISFPSSLKMVVDCKNPKSKEAFNNKSMDITYQCSGVSIVERYTKYGALTGQESSFIRASAGQWHVCLLASGLSYKCGVNFRSMLAAQTWLRDDTIDRWLLEAR